MKTGHIRASLVVALLLLASVPVMAGSHATTSADYDPDGFRDPTPWDIAPMYELGTFKPNENVYPGTKFPLPLGTNNTAYITSNFGYRYLNGVYDIHLGVDLDAVSGTSVYAAAGGTVNQVNTDICSNAGRYVVITHSGGWKIRYLHLSQINVNEGDTVAAGSLVGLSGGSGNCSESGYRPHLHFEVRHTVNGVDIPYDPIAFYTTRSSYIGVYSSNSGRPYIPTRRRGDSDIFVYLLQDALVYHGYSVTVDGVFGPQTESVVKSYQTAQGLTADGIVGPMTWTELMGDIGAQ